MVFTWVLCYGLVAAARCLAQSLPQQVATAQLRYLDAEAVPVEGAPGGLLLIPRAAPNYRDEKYHESYRFACHVYVAVRPPAGQTESVYQRRFLVCAGGPASQDFARQVGRMLLLLWSLRHDRLHDDHPLNEPTVNVWLTEGSAPGLSADTGGEQFRNQIYLFNVHLERSPIEWAREIAHEYGHYALPGISGFRAPEEWANGVLGERLFLKWLRDDVRAGRIPAAQLPLVSAALLDEFHARSIWPRIRPILQEGLDPRMITRTNADGMDYYTGLALYIDTVYGTPALVDAMQNTQSASRLTFPRAGDFLEAFTKTQREQSQITLRLPAIPEISGPGSLHFYLPAGAWEIQKDSGVASCSVAAEPKRGVAYYRNRVRARLPGWINMRYLRASGAVAAGQVTLRRSEH